MDGCTGSILNWAIVFFAIVGGFQHSNGQGFSLQIHHKLSEQLKTWMNLKHGMDRNDWPAEGSTKYYSILYHHDNVRHGRNLIDYQSLTFVDGNETARLNDLGFLYYTAVQVGTPNVSLLVALDTGSDLFWVPCDCKQCSPPALSSNGSNITFETYSPSASKTFKPVTCASDLCVQSRSCSKSTDQCPYNISYVSANTSSSGILVEDILYLTPGDSDNGEVVKARITFGCGSIQTGAFISGAAPDGLLGLGIENISVPSILSKSGVVGNYFSMCFPSNGSIGRFTFGYKGSSDQKQTSFIIDPKRPAYNVGVKEFYVGKRLISTAFEALFDTGTSFTYLADSAYKNLTSNFHLQVSDPTVTISDIPFEFCYSPSDDQSISKAPEISLIFNEGDSFPLHQPFLKIISDRDPTKVLAYCLAVLPSSSVTIIGENFMSGYEIVFDRDELKLGWKESNCYHTTYSGSSELSPGPLTANSSEISRRPAISPAALPANPNSSKGAGHMSSPFLQFAFSILASATILTLI